MLARCNTMVRLLCAKRLAVFHPSRVWKLRTRNYQWFPFWVLDFLKMPKRPQNPLFKSKGKCLCCPPGDAHGGCMCIWASLTWSNPTITHIFLHCRMGCSRDEAVTIINKSEWAWVRIPAQELSIVIISPRTISQDLPGAESQFQIW